MSPIFAAANPLSHLLAGQYPWIIAFGLLLLTISLFAWSVIVSKAMTLKRSEKTDKVFLQHYRTSKHPLEAFAQNAKSRGSILHSVYILGARELTYHWLGSSEVDETFEPRLRRADAMSKRETDLFRARLSRIASEASKQLESRMSFLSCLANGVPLLGLLATAWGLMVGFGNAQGNSGDFNSLQPSIGTSLSMSVLALLVAVPAGIGIRYLHDLLLRKSREIRDFCAEFDTDISHAYQNATTESEGASATASESKLKIEQAPSRSESPSTPSMPPVPSRASVVAEAAPQAAARIETAAPAPAATPIATPVAAVPAMATATVAAEQMTFEPNCHASDFIDDLGVVEDGPMINPVARQTARVAPELLFEAQV